MTHLKTLFWTTIFWIAAVGLFYVYLIWLNKPLASQIAGYISTTPTVCETTGAVQTADTLTQDVQALVQQSQMMQSQLTMLMSRLETMPNNTQPSSIASSTMGMPSSTNGMQTVKLYYFNQLEDAKLPNNQQLNTNSILPIQRSVMINEDIITDTINALIQTPLSPEEITQGFTSEFPNKDFRLISARLASDGTLTLEFTVVPGFTSGGSARVLLLKSAIEKTAMQFPDVKKVEFMPVDIFQP